MRSREAAGLDAVILLYIVGILGAHETVPDPEVEAIIAFELAVMEIMVGGSVEYFEEKRSPEIFGHDLIAQVAVYVDDKAADGENEDAQGVDGNYKNDGQEHGAFRPGLDKMKGIGGPGGRVGGAVVEQVGETEDGWMV